MFDSKEKIRDKYHGFLVTLVNDQEFCKSVEKSDGLKEQSRGLELALDHRKDCQKGLTLYDAQTIIDIAAKDIIDGLTEKGV